MIQKSAAQIRESSTGRKSMNDLIKSMEPEIKKALPSVITPERFTRMVLSAISMTPKLADCTPMSFLGAMMQAAQLGVEPNTPLGQAYLIPYNNKNTLECQFQLGYKGLIDLAYRSGEVEIVQAQIVYANDTFECEFGLNPRLKHVPAADDRGEPVKVYAIFKTKAGGYGFDVMSMEAAASAGDIFITVTGCKDVITKKHMSVMKNGVLLANAGHFDVEINKRDLEELAVEKRRRKPHIDGYILPDGRILNLLAEGRLVNLASGNGHPAEIMDMSFSLQAKCLEYLYENRDSLEKKVYDVPGKIDMEVATLKAASLGATLDVLTPQQIKYLSSHD